MQKPKKGLGFALQGKQFCKLRGISQSLKLYQWVLLNIYLYLFRLF